MVHLVAKKDTVRKCTNLVPKVQILAKQAQFGNVLTLCQRYRYWQNRHSSEMYHPCAKGTGTGKTGTVRKCTTLVPKVQILAKQAQFGNVLTLCQRYRYWQNRHSSEMYYPCAKGTDTGKTGTVRKCTILVPKVQILAKQGTVRKCTILVPKVQILAKQGTVRKC